MPSANSPHELLWRSLGEAEGNYRNINKTGTNQLGCSVTATTRNCLRKKGLTDGPKA
jgi:hypothetical protein